MSSFCFHEESQCMQSLPRGYTEYSPFPWESRDKHTWRNRPEPRVPLTEPRPKPTLLRDSLGDMTQPVPLVTYAGVWNVQAIQMSLAKTLL